MTPNAVIRPATPADVPAIGRLAVLLVQAHHDFDPNRFLSVTPHTEQGYADYLGTQLGQKRTVVLVAELNGGVCGYAWGAVEGTDYMSLRGPAGVLYDIVVDPEHRGKGIGALLLNAVLEALEALDAPRVVLSTAVRNEMAQRLFARAGFRPTMLEMTREASSGQDVR